MSLLSQQDSLLSNTVGQQISSSVVTVTPETAKKWLEGMIKNQRNPAEPVILKYSRAMQNNKWKLAAPLSFDVDEQLIDGQHRLLAVIKAGKPIDFIVLKGLSTEAIEAIDMGSNRTAAHLARLQGTPLTNRHLSLLNCCFYSTESSGRIPSLSKQEQVEIAKVHFEALDFAAQKRVEGAVDCAPYFAPVARAYYGENHKRLKEFLTVLHTGFTVSENPNDDLAAIALRNLYFRDRQSSRQLRVTGGTDKRISDFRKATSALRYFILRKPIKIIKEANVNHFPVADFDAWWKAAA